MVTEELKNIIKSKSIVLNTKIHTVMIVNLKNHECKYYDLTDGVFYEDRVSLRKEYSSDENIIIRYGQGYEYATYVKYHDDIECISMSKIFISKKLPNVNIKEKRNWKIGDTIWINKDKDIFTYNGNEFKEIKNSKELPILLTGEILESLPGTNTLLEEFGKLFPSINSKIPVHFVSSSKCQILKNLDNIMEFIFYKDSKKINGPKQNLIDSLCSQIKTKVAYEDIADNSVIQQMNGFKLERVNDKYCVLRMFYIDKTYKVIEEVSRVFFGKKDVIYTKKNYKNEFINARGKMSEEFFRMYHSNMIDFDLSIISGTRLEYYRDFVKDIPLNIRALMIILLDKYPFIEKMYKLNLVEYLNYGYQNFYALNMNFNIYSSLDKIFKININNTDNVMKFLGLNNYQLTQLISYSKNFDKNKPPQEQTFIFSEIKELIGKQDISNMDKKSFDVYLKSYIAYKQYSGEKSNITKIVKTIKLIRVLYSHQVAFNMIPKIFMLAITPTSKQRDFFGIQTILNYYYDYLNIVKKIEDTENFKAQFSSVDEIKLMHDNIVEIYNLKKEEYEIKKFNKQKEKWEKFIYENDTYKVIYPDKPELLAKEGIELRHCVKSYIDRVIDGVTNILFIRKQEDIDKPFFTVEISNKGDIEQVHGFGNRNASTEPGLEDFIKEWQDAIGLKSKNFNKIR